jgi:hypothetical protein
MLSRLARILAFLLVFLFSTALSSAAPQESSLDAVLDSLYGMCEYREVAISPDGQRVGWVETRHKAHGEPSPDAGIYVASLSPPSVSPLRITVRSAGGHLSWHCLVS